MLIPNLIAKIDIATGITTARPSTEEEIENMSLTDKLLLLILIVMCALLGAFVGYVIMDRLR